MASPTRLEEGWVGLPGQVPPDAAGSAAGQVSGRVLGSCAGALSAAEGPCKFARRQRVPDTPFSSPSQTTGSDSRPGQQQAQQQNWQPDPWAGYVGAGGRALGAGLGQQGFQQGSQQLPGHNGYLQPGHVLFEKQHVQQGAQQGLLGAQQVQGQQVPSGAACTGIVPSIPVMTHARAQPGFQSGFQTQQQPNPFGFEQIKPMLFSL